MEKRRKNLLKQSFEVMFKGDIEEILDKNISNFGSGAHITLSKKHRGKKAKVVIYK